MTWGDLIFRARGALQAHGRCRMTPLSTPRWCTVDAVRMTHVRGLASGRVLRHLAIY